MQAMRSGTRHVRMQRPCHKGWMGIHAPAWWGAACDAAWIAGPHGACGCTCVRSRFKLFVRALHRCGCHTPALQHSKYSTVVMGLVSSVLRRWRLPPYVSANPSMLNQHVQNAAAVRLYNIDTIVLLIDVALRRVRRGSTRQKQSRCSSRTWWTTQERGVRGILHRKLHKMHSVFVQVLYASMIRAKGNIAGGCTNRSTPSR